MKIWKIRIRDNLRGIKWLQCPESLSPADIPSRGINICKDKFLELQWNGSEFVIYSPQDNIKCHSANMITEEVVNKGKMEEKLNNFISIEKFSDYDKVTAVLCYGRRFIHDFITNKITRSLNIIYVVKKYDVIILSYYIFDFTC